MVLNKSEQERLIEIVFYKYFENRSDAEIATSEFWQCISAICVSYGIDNNMVIRAIRTLMADENKPSDYETWYLLHKLEMTVRPMKGFTGIYWQKQKTFEEALASGKPVKVRRCIMDPVMKLSMKRFVIAIFKVFGSYKYLSEALQNEILG